MGLLFKIFKGVVILDSLILEPILLSSKLTSILQVPSSRGQEGVPKIPKSPQNPVPQGKKLLLVFFPKYYSSGVVIPSGICPDTVLLLMPFF